MKNKLKNYSFIIRVFFSNILHSILKKVLGNIEYNYVNPEYKKSCIYYETKKFKIKTFDYIMRSPNHNFDWENFISDIKKNGIKQNPIVITIFESTSFNTYLFDGFHRVRAYEEIYGLDSEMVMDHYVHYNYLKVLKKYNEHIKNHYKNTIKNLEDKTYEK